MNRNVIQENPGQPVPKQRQTSPPVNNSLLVDQNFSQVHTEDKTSVALARIFTQEFPTSLSTSFYSLPAALTSHIITDWKRGSKSLGSP